MEVICRDHNNAPVLKKHSTGAAVFFTSSSKTQ